MLKPELYRPEKERVEKQCIRDMYKYNIHTLLILVPMVCFSFWYFNFIVYLIILFATK